MRFVFICDVRSHLHRRHRSHHASHRRSHRRRYCRHVSHRRSRSCCWEACNCCYAGVCTCCWYWYGVSCQYDVMHQTCHERLTCLLWCCGVFPCYRTNHAESDALHHSTLHHDVQPECVSRCDVRHDIYRSSHHSNRHNSHSNKDRTNCTSDSYRDNSRNSRSTKGRTKDHTSCRSSHNSHTDYSGKASTSCHSTKVIATRRCALRHSLPRSRHSANSRRSGSCAPCSDSRRDRHSLS